MTPLTDPLILTPLAVLILCAAPIGPAWRALVRWLRR